VAEWAQLHRSELAEDWERSRQRQPLESIPPLD
jgi:hypothetical protein